MSPLISALPGEHHYRPVSLKQPLGTTDATTRVSGESTTERQHKRDPRRERLAYLNILPSPALSRRFGVTQTAELRNWHMGYANGANGTKASKQEAAAPGAPAATR